MSDTPRLFDTGLAADETRVQQIQSNTLSLYERQQNMRLKELQNNRQEMLAQTQVKMNEANIMSAEYDLERKKATQDLVLKKTEFDLASSKFDLETKKQFIEESLTYKEKAKGLNKEYEEILAITDEDERLRKLSAFDARNDSIAKRYNIPDYAVFSGMAGEQYKQLNDIRKLNMEMEKEKRITEIERIALKKMQDDNMLKEGQGGSVGSTRILGTASQASNQPKYERKAQTDIFGLGNDFIKNFQFSDAVMKTGADALTNPREAIAQGKAIKEKDPEYWEEIKSKVSTLEEELQDEFYEVIRQVEGGSAPINTPTGGGNLNRISAEDAEKFLQGLVTSGM